MPGLRRAPGRQQGRLGHLIRRQRSRPAALTWIIGPVCALGRWKEVLIVEDKQSRAARRDRQTREVEENQRQLRTSIATSARLVDEAEAMIKRHRDECDAADNEVEAEPARRKSGAA